MSEERYSIDIDCPPGDPRPGDLFPGVLKDTGLTTEDFEEGGRFFGNWTWYVRPNKAEQYLKARDTIKAHLTALYNSGVIRYASW